jgi:hypothetical protein
VVELSSGTTGCITLSEVCVPVSVETVEYMLDMLEEREREHELEEKRTKEEREEKQNQRNLKRETLVHECTVYT